MAGQVADNILALCQQPQQDEQLSPGRLELVQFLQVMAVRLQGGAWGAYAHALAQITTHL